jgi:hypothetical protein
VLFSSIAIHETGEAPGERIVIRLFGRRAEIFHIAYGLRVMSLIEGHRPRPSK